MVAGRTRKVQPSRRISARKPRYPTEKARAAGTSKSEQLSDLGIYSKTKIQPAVAHRNGTFIVGYLGFRAETSSNRCTNCSRKTSLEGSRLDSQRIKGSSWMPFSCFAKFFDRRTQVLSQLARSLSERRRAQLCSTRSEKCSIFQSFRLRPPLAKTCAHRAKRYQG